MVKKLCFVWLSFFCLTLSASNFKGSSTFLQEDGDTDSFVHAQLKFRAFKSVISQELRRLRLNPKNFWKAYSESFNNHFKSKVDALKTKYAVSEVTEKIPKSYFRELRRSRLSSKSRYMNIDRSIASFVINETKNSPNNARYWTMRVTGEVNREALKSVYHQLVKKKETKVKKLIIGFEGKVKRKITDNKLASKKLQMRWRDWMRTVPNFSVVEDIVISDEILDQRILEHIKTGEHFDEFNGSVYLKVKEKAFVRAGATFIAGQISPTDLETLQEESPITFKHHVKKSLRIDEFYKAPLVSFKGYIEKLSRNKLVDGKKELVVAGFNNVNDLYALIEEIESPNFIPGTSATVQFKTYSKEKAVLSVEVIGDSKNYLQSVVNKIARRSARTTLKVMLPEGVVSSSVQKETMRF